MERHLIGRGGTRGGMPAALAAWTQALLGGTAIVLVMPLTALAACNPAADTGPVAPAPGTTVTCSGNTTNQNATAGYGTGDQVGLTINVQSGATVAGTVGNNPGISVGTANAIDNAGTVTGTGGTAISFQGSGNTLTLQPGSVINGNVLATGGNNNTFQLGGTGAATFDTSLIGASGQYRNFNTFNKVGASTWALVGGTNQLLNWTISAGTLQLGDGGSGNFGSLSSVVNNSTLAFNHADTLIYGAANNGTQTISGTGVFQQLGTGTTVLTANNTYTGGTTIAVGSALVLGFGGTTGSILGDVANSGRFAVNHSDAFTFGGVVSGTGSFQQFGAGTTTLTGANTYTGGTNITRGTLQLGNGGTSGSIVGNVTNNANLAFNRSDTVTFGGVISGSGAVQQNGTGTTTLTGANTYTGGTNISRGTLQLGNGGTSGSIVGNVTNNANLAFNRSDAVTFDGVISGSGAVQQNGAGSTNLTATNTYTGATTVNSGTLAVNGSIASSSLTTVNAGATLAGNGTVGNTTINGGTLSPGNSIGLLTVQGNLVFTAASSYLVEVSPANADRTNVTGTATLGGATVNASFAAGTYVEKQYTIVNATGGVIGTFNTLANTNLPGGFKSSLSYDGNNAFLNLALDFTPTPTPTVPTGLNVNQTNVANALTGFFNRTGGIPMVFGTLTPTGLTIASGEIATASQQTTFDAMGMFVGLLTDPFVGGRGDPVTAGASAAQFADDSDTARAYASNGKPRSKDERDAYAAIYRKAPPFAPFVPSWSVWAAGYGGSQTTDGNTALGSNNTRSSIGGVAVGADYRFSPNTLAGFALAGGGTNFSVNGLGTGRSDLFQAGAFLRHTVGPTYLAAALAYGWQDITTDRTVTIAGTDVLRAKFNANAFSGRVEGGYRFVTPWMAMGLTPYAAGQFTTFDLPAYAEQVVAGANTFALSYAAKDVTASRSELGLRSDKSWAMQNGIFTLRGRAAWAHNFNTDRNVSATFQTLPGASFVVNGAQQASDSALVTGSAEMKWLNGFSLAGTFEGEFSNVTTSYAGKGVVRYAW